MKKIFFSMLVVLFTACGGAKDITVDKLSFERKMTLSHIILRFLK